MIKFMKNPKMPKQISEFAVRNAFLIDVYGESTAFLNFWSVGKSGLISLLSGHAVISGVCADEYEELAAFLSMEQQIKSVRTDAEMARCIFKNGLIREWTLTENAVMFAGDRVQKSTLIPKRLEAKNVYPLLVKCFGEHALPPFEEWYVDVMYKVRHGKCDIFGFEREQRLGLPTATLTCAMSVAKTDTHAVIGAVCTDEEARGKGFGSEVVLFLTEKLKAEGKTVLLSPKNDMARKLYEKIGFEVCGRWGELKRVRRK